MIGGAHPISRFPLFRNRAILFAICIASRACSETSEGRGAPAQPGFDRLIRNGTRYEGGGDEPFVAENAVVTDRIAAIVRGNIQ
jgi:hypothetical protein